MKRGLLTFGMLLGLAVQADAQETNNCVTGDVLGGKITENPNTKLAFLDLQLDQGQGNICMLRLRIDTKAKTVGYEPEGMDEAIEKVIGNVVRGKYVVGEDRSSGRLTLTYKYFDGGQEITFKDLPLKEVQDEKSSSGGDGDQ